jgi:hypothetical protein
VAIRRNGAQRPAVTVAIETSTLSEHQGRSAATSVVEEVRQDRRQAPGACLGHGPADNSGRSLPDTPDLPFAWEMLDASRSLCSGSGFFLTQKR